MVAEALYDPLAVRLASEEWLRRTGLAGERPEVTRASWERRGVVVGLLDAAGALTRTGASRATRVQTCGAPVLCEVQGPRKVERSYTRLTCRDRWCPECQGRRRQELLPRIAEVIEQRLGVADLALVTLTQRKRPGEAPGDAVDRLLASWRLLCKRRFWARSVAGGLRALEVTAHAAGTRHRKKGRDVVIAESGTHAHLHLVAELRPGVSRPGFAEDVRRAWCEGADAVSAAQDVQWLSAGRGQQAAAELGAYVLDGLAELLKEIQLEPVGSPRYRYLVGVLSALDGRRTLATWGEWRRRLSLRPASSTFAHFDLFAAPIAALEVQPSARSRAGREVKAPEIAVMLAEVARGGHPRGLSDMVASWFAPAGPLTPARGPPDD